MNKETEIQRRKRNLARKTAYLYFINGIKQLMSNPLKLLIVVGYGLLAVVAWCYRDKLLFELDSNFLLYPVFTIAVDFSVAVLLLFGLLCLISVIGTPYQAKRVQDHLINAGFTNHKQQPPLLLSKYKHHRNPKVMIWEFDQNQMPLSVWNDKREQLNGALLNTVFRVEQSKNGKRIILYTTAPHANLPSMIYWQDSCFSEDSFILALGESITGVETVDLTKVPHILLGGSSGSGKSVLLKLLLMQCAKKGSEVYIADFKGGVDFSPAWHSKCQMCFDEIELLALLTGLTQKLEQRKVLFRAAVCSNLDEYNITTNNKEKRVIFACDEIAELLDKTGLPKEKKELVLQIESQLSIIARQGRAFGIHLILATQRPSADILSGQIRNNIDCRICGRADTVLSQIILDSSVAAELIPKNAQGRFITNTGVVFQSYLFDENKMFCSSK